MYNAATASALNYLNRKVDDFKAGTLQTANIIVSDTEAMNNLSRNDYSGLQKKLQQYVDTTKCDAVSISDTKGNIIASSGKDLVGKSIAGKISFQKAVSGNSAAFVEEDSDAKLIVMGSVPVTDFSKNVFAVVSVTIKLNDTRFIDNLKADTGTELTIFAGDERINTSIVQDGKRLIGTKVSETVAKKILTEKQTYIGVADILGKKYISLYKPIFDGNSKVIGIIFSGVSNQEKNDSVRSIIINMLISMAVIIIVSMASLIFIIRKTIKKPINKLIAVARQFADGKLDADIRVPSKDEIGALYGTFIEMSDKLNHVLSSINAATDQVAMGSKQIAGTSMNLSQGATEQASAIEQLTASIEQITAQANANAESADQANRLSETAKIKSVEGSEQMESMIRAMDEINASSNNISKIIKVIDDIAFQTNILSLNAAVEAARAGQYGKGFAVVAEEVKNLAESCANAAKNTSDMIEASIANVRSGTAVARRTDASLKEILSAASSLADIINSIKVASDEQLIGLRQVNEGISQVSQVVQTNSATAEESAAASEELQSQAELLKTQVASFRLKEIF